MTTIETVVMINGKPADGYTMEELIALTHEETLNAKRLEDLPFESEAVKKLVKKHQANVKALLEQMDLPARTGPL